MYGLVNLAIHDMVVEKLGAETWERIRAEAGADDVFISMQQYPDETTVALVGAASRVLGISSPEVMRMFGDYWVGFTAERYGALFEMSGSNLVGFVQNLNNLHTRVGQIMPELKPPSFTVTDIGPESFRLAYYSSRPGFHPMLHGLLSGLGRRFGNTVEIEHLGGREQGKDHEEFLVRYRSVA